MTHYRNRIIKLLETARGMAREQRRAVRRVICKGRDWEAVIDQVVQAISPADADVVEKITDVIEEAGREPVLDYGKGYTLDAAGRSVWPVMRDQAGHIVYQRHHFYWWLLGLQHGSWSLPERLPR